MSDFDFFGNQNQDEPKDWDESLNDNECPICGCDLITINEAGEDDQDGDILFCEHCGEEF